MKDRNVRVRKKKWNDGRKKCKSWKDKRMIGARRKGERIKGVIWCPLCAKVRDE